ncbi:MAG: hypothetical protein ABI318_20680 [Chthoniobacteraceae bacterium]
MAQSEKNEPRPRVDPIEGKKLFDELRQQALNQTSKAPSLSVKSETEPYGFVMDMEIGGGIATVVAFNDGNASIYLSSGGGWIGGSGVDGVKKAAEHLFVVAPKFQPLAKLTKEFPLPKDGETIFHLLTDSGVFTLSAPTNDLGEQRHRWSPLFNAAQDIITQFQLNDEKTRRRKK